MLQQKYGEDSSVLEKTLAAALLYTPQKESQRNTILAEKGYAGVLQNICGLSENNPAYGRILDMALTKHIL